MKGKEYIIRRCENAVKNYFSSDDENVRISAANEIDLLTDILEPEEIPLDLILKMHHVLFDAVLSEYKRREFIFE